jgi:hypothetical protein
MTTSVSSAHSAIASGVIEVKYGPNVSSEKILDHQFPGNPLWSATDPSAFDNGSNVVPREGPQAVRTAEETRVSVVVPIVDRCT